MFYISSLVSLRMKPSSSFTVPDQMIELENRTPFRLSYDNWKVMPWTLDPITVFGTSLRYIAEKFSGSKFVFNGLKFFFL